jgi:hypothetical protein
VLGPLQIKPVKDGRENPIHALDMDKKAHNCLKVGFEGRVIRTAHRREQIPQLMDQTALMGDPPIQRLESRLRSGTPIGDDQREMPTVQAPLIQIVQQPSPCAWLSPQLRKASNWRVPSVRPP